MHSPAAAITMSCSWGCCVASSREDVRLSDVGGQAKFHSWPADAATHHSAEKPIEHRARWSRCRAALAPGRNVRGGIVSRVTPVHTAVRNCTRDEGGPFEVGNQVLISSHRKLLSLKATVVNVAEKSEQDSGRHG